MEKVYCINCKWMLNTSEILADSSLLEYALFDCPDNRDVYTKSSPVRPPYTVSHRQYCTDANKGNGCKHYTPLPDAPLISKKSFWSKLVRVFKNRR